MSIKNRIFPIVLLSFFLILPSSAYAAEVTLNWDASSGGPTGYRIYYGTIQGSHPDSVDVENVTQYTLTGLQEDVTYYFVLRAYNVAGESGDSNEVSWISTSDTEPPTVSISSPTTGDTYVTDEDTITIGGTASDDVGVTSVTWVNDRGGDGTASGTTSWTISNISLQEGDNVITVTAHDAAGNTGEDILTVTYTPPPPDTEPPTVTITDPTSSTTYSTENSTISLGGAASDNIGVTGVTWVNDRGGSGTASGTDSWTISNIPLQEGNNVITVTAHDAAENTGTDTLTVTYTPPAGMYTQEFGSATGADYPGALQDTFININTTNNSSENLLNTYTYPQDKVANAIIMKWDLSAIPGSATIQDATLYLYLSSMEGTGGDDLYDLTAHKIINYNPVISACTGYTYDGTNSWTPTGEDIPLAQVDIAPVEDTESIDKTYGYKSWSVTNMVQDWVSNSASNYGMLVNSDTVAGSDSNRFFSATESSDPDQRPKLVITYSVGQGALTSPTGLKIVQSQ